MYNPGTSTITVTAVGAFGTIDTVTLTPNEAERFGPIPSGSGVRVFTDSTEDVFFAVTQTDDEDSPDSSGLAWDWGHPLIPDDQLTSQALIGLGIGCPELLDTSVADCDTATAVTEGAYQVHCLVVCLRPRF